MRLLNELCKDASFIYSNNPLNDVVDDISCRHYIPMLLERRALEKAEIDDQILISAAATDVPLYAALTEMLAPLKLTYVYRYDLLWITTADSVLHDDDLAPQIITEGASSEMLTALANEVKFDYLDQPIADVLQDLALMHKFKIEYELMDSRKLVSMHYRSCTLKSGLGVLCHLYDLRCEAQGNKLVVVDAEDADDYE